MFIFYSVGKLDALCQVATMLKLKSFLTHIKDTHLKTTLFGVDRGAIESLNIAQKNGMHSFVQDELAKKTSLKHFNLIKTPKFKALHKEIQYELLKSSVLNTYRYLNKEMNYYTAEWMEVQFIFNFLDLIIYENRTADIVARKNSWTSEPVDVNIEKDDINLESISCPKNSPNRVTLVVEDIEINVNSFILTNNSPVFKAMLNSTFKEGRNRKIELPGKKFQEIVYFLQFLHAPQDVDGICFLPLPLFLPSLASIDLTSQPPAP